MSETMPNWLLQRANLTPDRPAIITEKQTITYLELLHETKKMAAQLAAVGVKPGDNCGLLIKNRVESVVLIRALESIGAVCVLLNVRLTMEEIVWQMNDAHVSSFFYDKDFGDVADQITTNLPSVHSYSFKQLQQEKQAGPIVLRETFELEELHTIMYTSGTTGKPKGVQLTYGNHWWSAIGSSLNLGLHADDRWLACVPIFHVSGLSILMRAMFYGITVVLHERFDPNEVNKSIEENNVTMISVVSAMLTEMLKQQGKQAYPKSLRCVLLGGGPAPMPLLEECKGRNIPIFQTYGMTETASQVVTLAPEYMLSKLGSAGKPLYPASVRIEVDGRAARSDEAGEIVVKGPNVTNGYYRRRDATREAIQDGWFYTGDIGFLDEDGFLYVLDRRSDLLISGGENVYPAEIESVLLEHEAIEEAGICGVESEKWGEVPAAFVVFQEGESASVDELIHFCSQKLASYKVPKIFYKVEQLPRNASKKLLRRTLKKWVNEKIVKRMNE
ncbi:o-succinylbenzoate--CoA ligase [Bacillus tianshenii]|nr:o-succinylbenzoate--CoA ligase [Bacillus tianshenii]